jgi:hypothetical protein
MRTGKDYLGAFFASGHLRRPEGLAQLCPPGIFFDQMAETALRLRGVGLAVVQSVYPSDMGDGLEGAVNVAALTVFGDDLVAFYRRQVTSQGLVEPVWLTRQDIQTNQETTGVPEQTHKDLTAGGRRARDGT